MQVSYRWIKEMLNFEIAPDRMIETLISLGHEVEGVVDLGLMGNPIRVVRILKVEAHPDPEAKNLKLCQVDDGSGEPITVVCGAPNVAEGQLSVLARTGARLPNGKTLRKARIRGVASEGMLMAPDEMGLGSDHSGIVVLEDDAKVGDGYDVLFTVEITPNRPDCLSIRGLAREIAAANNRKVYTDRVRLRETFETVHDLTNISVKVPEACPRYAARIVRGVTVRDSPPWLKRRLLACGLRPINNVVDATNYVLMEFGHPMHAFDFDRLEGRRIVVRMASAGEKIETLDGSTIELRAGKDMVIADAEKPVALAGIMGGANSQVTERTENLLLESAYFDPPTIRRTSREHHISTDSSYRFERGTDLHALTEALDRVVELILDVAGGEVPRGIADTLPHPPASAQFMIRPARAVQVLGVNIPKLDMADLISALGFEIVRSDSEIMVLSAPTYRVDITREEDIFEEIVRLYGYNRVEPTMPYLPATTRSMNPAIRLQRLVRDKMTAMGFFETVHLSFIGGAQLDELGLDGKEALKVLNPLSREMDTLRPLLAPAMLQTLQRNQNRGNLDAALFEVGATFHFGDMATPTVERPALSIAAMGACHPRSWQGEAPAWDFFRMKGVVVLLLEALGIGKIQLDRSAPSILHSGRSASIRVDDQAVGWFGEISPALRRQMGFKGRPLLAELHLDTLAKFATESRRACELPKFPAMERDLALVVDQDTPAEKVERTIRAAGGELLESVWLFDCYEGEQVARGRKSLAYRLVYRHAERTLTDDEADAMQKQVLKAVADAVGASLRE